MKRLGIQKRVTAIMLVSTAALGTIGCAVILPAEAARNESVTADNHNLLLARLNDSDSIVYYAGACWSKTPEFDSEEKWLKCVQKKVRLIGNPLKIEVLTE